MNQARTLVELGELYAVNLLTEKKSTFPGKDTFKLQKEKTPKAAEAKKDAFITTKSKLGSGPGAAVGFVKSQLDPKLIKKAKNDEYGVLKDSPVDKEFSVSSEKSEVKTINNSMNKSIFDRLYEEVMGDETSPVSHSDIESADAEALDLPTGEEEGEVTVTLSRELASKLHDALMAVLSTDEEAHDEELEGEDAEFDDEERHGDANGRWSDKRTGRSHRDDQGDDEDAETAFEATDIKELPSSVSKMTQKNNKVSDSWSTHHVDGKIGEGEIDGEIDAKGKSYKIYGAADGVPDTADTIPVPVKPVPVDSKVTKNVGKVLFATGKDSYKAPKGVMRDFRKL